MTGCNDSDIPLIPRPEDALYDQVGQELYKALTDIGGFSFKDTDFEALQDWLSERDRLKYDAGYKDGAKEALAAWGMGGNDDTTS